ncbi:MAG: glycosyltransferase family 2 protein [Alphaproteobacteria bacterium]
MLVSVVIPSYNHASFVADAVRSVAEQSYADIELIVVDDSSPDDSAAIVRALLDSNDMRRRFGPRATFHAQSGNRGAIETINRGLALASGDILTLLNSDDLYDPARIARLVDVFRDSAVELAFTGVRIIDAVGSEYDSAHPFARYLRGQIERIDSMPTVGFALMRDNVSISTGNLAFRRRMLDALGGFRRYLWCHDWDFVLRALLFSEPVFIHEPLYSYRMHGNNTFQTLDRWLGDLEAAEIIGAYLAAVRAERYTNPLAPSPRNWPGVFERILIEAGKWPEWRGRR